MEQGLSGGTTNLLRMARSGCQSASSFVALALTDDSFATAVYPATPEPGALDASMVDAVVRQLWHEPGLAQGKALVRTVRIGDTSLAVAVVPLAVDQPHQPSGILGVAGPGGQTFGLPDLELLSRIAQRLTSYVRARRTVRSQLAHAAADARADASTAAPPSEGQPSPPASGVVQPPASPGGGGAAGGFPPPPFPPPAGTLGVERVWRAGAAERQTSPPPPGPTRPWAEPARVAQDESVRSLLGADGGIEGLVPLGALLGRAGRLLGAGTAMTGSLAVVAVEVDGVAEPSVEEATRVAGSIRAELRFDDPLARIGALAFVAVVPLAPGGATGAQVEAHLARQVRAAVARHPRARVHVAHVVAPLSGGQDADELLRAAVVKLRAH